MHKIIPTLCILLALGTLLVGSPAHAQNVTSLTLSPNAVVSGQELTATVTLSSAAPAGGAQIAIFALSRAVIPFPRQDITVPQGQTSIQVDLHTLPVDSHLYTFVGASHGTSTQWAGLTLWAIRPFRTRLATFRPTGAQWFLYDNATGVTTTVQFGQTGDVPLPQNYHDGTDLADILVFRPSTAEWLLRPNNGSAPETVQFGNANDTPIPSDYLGTGRPQLAVFRPSTEQWLIRDDTGTTPTTITTDVSTITQPGDRVVPGDYLGLGRAQFTVFRPNGATDWIIRQDDGSTLTVDFGEVGDLPVPGDYFGTGREQIAVYRPSTLEWLIREDDGDFAPPIVFGEAGDIPVPGDYLGTGITQIAVFRPSTGEWFIRDADGETIGVEFGGQNDVPVPAPYAPGFGT